MESAISSLLEYGIAGIFAAMGFLLYFRERKAHADSNKEFIQVLQKHTEEFVQHTVAETASKIKLTEALHSLVESVDALDTRQSRKVDDAVVLIREQIARDEGRREVTGRFRIPEEVE